MNSRFKISKFAYYDYPLGSSNYIFSFSQLELTGKVTVMLVLALTMINCNISLSRDHFPQTNTFTYPKIRKAAY